VSVGGGLRRRRKKRKKERKKKKPQAGNSLRGTQKRGGVSIGGGQLRGVESKQSFLCIRGVHDRDPRQRGKKRMIERFSKIGRLKGSTKKNVKRRGGFDKRADNECFGGGGSRKTNQGGGKRVKGDEEALGKSNRKERGQNAAEALANKLFDPPKGPKAKAGTG